MSATKAIPMCLGSRRLACPMSGLMKGSLSNVSGLKKVSLSNVWSDEG